MEEILDSDTSVRHKEEKMKITETYAAPEYGGVIRDKGDHKLTHHVDDCSRRNKHQPLIKLMLVADRRL